MASTPEGKVKKAVRTLLNTYRGLYQFWPVPYGYGESSLDCLITYRGRFIAIETKAPGGKPTPRQDIIIERILDGGAPVFVIEGTEGIAMLREYLDELSYQPETRGSRRPATS